MSESKVLSVSLSLATSDLQEETFLQDFCKPAASHLLKLVKDGGGMVPDNAEDCLHMLISISPRRFARVETV